MPVKPSSLPLRRILLAEDDDSMRGFIVKALEKANYDVVAFENGEEIVGPRRRAPLQNQADRALFGAGCPCREPGWV